MNALLGIAQRGVVVILVAGLALSLGWLTRFAYIITLPMVLVGLVGGALVGFFSLLSEPPRPRIDRLVLALSVLAGFLCFQLMDDIHHVSTFRRNVAQSLYADSGAAGTELIDDEELEFFGRGADDILARNMERSVGFSGPVARWLHRADGGVRTFGSWEQRRVVPVGRNWAILFMLLEGSIAFWMGLRVLRRVRLVAARESAGEGEDLEDKG